MADPVADDNVDISGMPDPSSIGLSPAAQADPTDGMPEPKELFKKATGTYPATQYALDEFMKNPVNQGNYQPTARKAVSQLTGLPRAAAGIALSVPAGVASIAGQASGAADAVAALGTGDTDLAGKALERGRDRGREWAKNVNNLANYVPATKRGAEFSNDLTGLPANLIKETSDSTLGKVLPDNAYQAVGDVAQDIGTDLPALGAPGTVRAGVKGMKAGVGAAKRFAASEAASATAPEPTPEPSLKPPTGEPITGDTLRAAPNPIPAPEGTLHRSATEDGRSPAAPPAKPAEPTPAAETQPSVQETAAQPATPAGPITPAERHAANRALDALDSQRGSVRIFNSPAEEGPKETPAPEQQNERAGHLDAIDRLSGGQLPTRRLSALTGDYNATGDDFQMKEVGNEQMRKQVASENAAMHTATENVHNSIGSEFENSVDSQTLGDRGRVARNAIQGIEGWFDKATDQIYDTARSQNQGRPISKLQRVSDYLNDDSNFTNDAEIGLQRAAKQRMERLWTIGDPDKGTPPGSVNAAERMREFLNEKGRNPNAMGVAKDLKNHLDMDVAEHGGPGLFQAARAMRRHSAQMLEEPTGIKKLLAPSDSQGINHAIPEHKVMDYIADLPREQHEHVLNVLRAGAHLGGGELAEGSAAALREIQAHVISRMHNAARNADGSWNARKFYNAADRYARNAPALFKDRPDVLNNLKTINDAGNTLHMDKHYPGAAAQTERTGTVGHILEAGGNIASGLAHDIPVVGRMVGRAMERGVEGLGGKISESSRDKAVAKRIVDRTGKQRGAVGDLSQRDAVNHEVEDAPSLGLRYHSYSTPHGGGLDVREIPGLGVRKSYRATQPAAERGKGWGTRTLQRAVDDAHEAGQTFHSDSQVSESQAGAYKNLVKLGYDVKAKPYENVQGELKAHGDHVFEVRPPKGKGSTLNVGLHQGQEGQPGFRSMSKQEAQGAIESTGAKTTKTSVLTPKEHGVSEPTLVASTDRPLSDPEMQKVLAKTKQSAIPQRTDAGVESMHVAPSHEAIAKEQGWDKFDAKQFRGHPGQRGSFSFQNDNELNNATSAARDRQRGVGIEPRNERNERVANAQMGGRKPLTAEQNDILRRLSGQRGSVQVMKDVANKVRDKMEDVGESLHGFDQDVMDKATDVRDNVERFLGIRGDNSIGKRLKNKILDISENVSEKLNGADQDMMDKDTELRDKAERVVGIRGPSNQRGSVRVMNEKPLAGAPTDGTDPMAKHAQRPRSTPRAPASTTSRSIPIASSTRRSRRMLPTRTMQ
jgi:hypothetical protein